MKVGSKSKLSKLRTLVRDADGTKHWKTGLDHMEQEAVVAQRLAQAGTPCVSKLRAVIDEVDRDELVLGMCPSEWWRRPAAARCLPCGKQATRTHARTHCHACRFSCPRYTPIHSV